MVRGSEARGRRRFGRYLRSLRLARRMTLAEAEALSMGMPERVSIAYLSRLESGQTNPTLTRLATLARLYDLPTSAMVERYEIENRLAARETDDRADPDALPPERVRDRARESKASGRYLEALGLLEDARDRLDAAALGGDRSAAARALELRMGAIECLVHLGFLEAAKLDAERLLSDPATGPAERRMLWQAYVACCFRLGRYDVALAGLERAERELDRDPDAPERAPADLAVLRGNLLRETGRPDDSLEPYTRALRTYERIDQRFEACRARIHLGGALVEAGKPRHAAEHLAAGLEAAERGGHRQLQAIALGNLAVLHHRRGDDERAESAALRSNAIARDADLHALVFRNTWYLFEIARAAGREREARGHERALRLALGRVPETLPEVAAFRAARGAGAPGGSR